MSYPLFLEKLTLHNFRSVRAETVTFANPLFLVGQNGSGKSNFVDALAFISECMTSPLQSVIERRGGLGRVGYLQTPHESPYISLRVDFGSDGVQPSTGFYLFTLQVTARRENGVVRGLNYEVVKERCELNFGDSSLIWFDRINNLLTTSVPGVQMAIAPQSLAVSLLSAIPAFSSVYQRLASMRVYRINPDRISDIQDQDSEPFLKSDSSNINGVLHRLSNRGQLRRVTELLQTVVPGVVPAPSDFSNGKGILYFEQQWPGVTTVLEAASMSTGTLSTLGLVVAALQDPLPSLIAIEEPELNIHPGALEAIADIIHIAAERTQVVVTTHSPDLLDTKWIQPENLRVVEWKDGATQVSDLGSAPVKALRQHLMGAGELMRANALDAAAPVLEEALA